MSVKDFRFDLFTLFIKDKLFNLADNQKYNIEMKK